MSSSTPNTPSNMTAEERARRIEILKRRRAAEEAAARSRNASGQTTQNASSNRAPNGKRKPPLNPDGTPMTRAQYEEARRKALAARASAQNPSGAQAGRAAQRVKKTSPSEALLNRSEDSPRRKTDLVTKVDPKTGRQYKEIPKVGSSGDMPELAIEDFDLDNLQGEADAFLGHLRVPPSKSEALALRKKKEEMAAAQKAQQAEELKAIESKYGKEKLAWTHGEDNNKDDLETTTNKKKGFFSKFFKK